MNNQATPLEPDRTPARAARGPNSKGSAASWSFDAAIFDMDGVVTNTTAVHAAAWKEMFDAFLAERAARSGEPFVEFARIADYLAYVDGRPRYDGVESFLRSRGIRLPRGTPLDPPGRETACGLGNQKNVVFNRLVEREGVATFASTLRLIRDLRQGGIKVGLATSSYNSGTILEKAGAAGLFGTVVDGVESTRRGLKGKPAPDIFAAAAADLGVANARAIVFEDAITGVQAGSKGGFALVIGIAREGNERELREHGADVVVRDLADTSLEQINQLVQDKRTVGG